MHIVTGHAVSSDGPPSAYRLNLPQPRNGSAHAAAAPYSPGRQAMLRRTTTRCVATAPPVRVCCMYTSALRVCVSCLAPPHASQTSEPISLSQGGCALCCPATRCQGWSTHRNIIKTVLPLWWTVIGKRAHPVPPPPSVTPSSPLPPSAAAGAAAPASAPELARAACGRAGAAGAALGPRSPPTPRSDAGVLAPPLAPRAAAAAAGLPPSSSSSYQACSLLGREPAGAAGGLGPPGRTGAGPEARGRCSPTG